ncbi:MAG: Ppx/GppA family phosphatase [Methylobacteriaceae bacterium]|jgi:exopolyphosphatase/guanosine-5'-triphosphate,3'-diphosphate pyrophosphatase|nr:Ppx/GppA family phosphatase [Methylobacteriaceae bacterium]
MIARRTSEFIPVGIVDIGSNSVRLVVYEGELRVPAIIHNEKVMCGLGRNVMITGMLEEEGMASAMAAIARFRNLCELMRVDSIRIIATAAVRQARNGKDFLERIRAFWDVPIELISGEREAHLSSLGIHSGFFRPDGVVGDLGGGSLELARVTPESVEPGVSLPLGGLALRDLSSNSPKEAEKITEKELKKAEKQIEGMKGRSFFCVGGTWRAIARMHQNVTKYPVYFMHGYARKREEMLDFLKDIEKGGDAVNKATEEVDDERKPLIIYGALVLRELLKQGKPEDVLISATGVRDGAMFEALNTEVQAIDPLSDAVERLSRLRSRSVRHGYELFQWAKTFIDSLGRDPVPFQDRLLFNACLISDISWRAHPDYRADHATAIVEYAYFLGLSHPERCFLALSCHCRYNGANDYDHAPAGLRKVVGDKLGDFAKLSGAVNRVAYGLSVGMPDVLSRTPMVYNGGKVVLTLPREFEQLANGRLISRFRQLGKLLKIPVTIDMHS